MAEIASTVLAEPQAKLFISYSQRDCQALVDKIKTALADLAVEAFVDRHDIEKNDAWRKALDEAIDGAHAFLFVISKHSVTSVYCAKELARAERQKKHIIAAIAETVARDTIPLQLEGLQHTDFRDPEAFAASIAELNKAIRTDFAWKRKANAFFADAQNWAEGGRARGLMLKPPRLEAAEAWLAERPKFMVESGEVRSFVEASRVAWNTGRRNLLIGAAIAAVAALFLYQTREFEKQRANSNFRVATGIANDVIARIFPVLRNRRGIDQSTVLEILGPTEKIVGELVAGLGDEPKVQDLRMRIDNEFQQTYWFVGDIDKATKYVREALALNLALAEDSADRTDAEGRKEYIALLELRTGLQEDLANVLHVTGRMQDFVAALNAARETAEKVVRLTGDSNPAERLKLSLAIGRIGDAFRKSGRYADAEREYARGEALQKQYLEDHPGDAAGLHALSWSDNRIGDNALHISQHEGFLPLDRDLKPRFAKTPEGRVALDRYGESYRIRAKLHDEDPTDKIKRGDLAWSVALYGMATMAFDIDKSIEILDGAAALAQEMAQSEGDDTQTQRYSALIYLFRGDAYVARGDLRSAFADYSRSEALREGLTHRDPANMRWQMDLMYLYEHLSIVFSDLGNREKAREYGQRGAALSEPVLKAFPGDDNAAASASLLASQAK